MTLRRAGAYWGRKSSLSVDYTGILDDYQANAYRTHGFFKFFSDYTGDCIIVNTSDNSDVVGTSTSIGFKSNGMIDLDQLLSVADGGSLYISEFLDLSGNGRHSVNFAGSSYKKRLRIVNNGEIEFLNGMPSSFCHVNGIGYNLSPEIIPNTEGTLIYIHELGTSAAHIKMGAPSNSSTGFSFVAQDGSTSTLINGSAFVGNTLRANKNPFVGSNRDQVHSFLDGKKIVSEYSFTISGSRTGSIWLNYGANGTAGLLNGKISCFLMWSSDLGTFLIDEIMDILNDIYLIY